MSKLCFRLSMAVFALVLISSCVKEDITDAKNDKTLITFSVRVPGSSAPTTRAMGSGAENEVRTMDIIMFDVAGNGGGFVHHVNAGSVTIDASRKGTFSVQLPLGTYDMVLVANAADEVAAAVSALTAGTSTKANLQAALTLTNTGKWNADASGYKPIPMWAEHSSATITEGAAITGIDLMRMLARIDVEVASTANFSLKEAYLYHPVTKGYIIPDATNNVTGTQAHTPTVDNGWIRHSSALAAYTATNGEIVNGKCASEIYTFEAPAGDGTASNGSDMTNGNTFLVIGGSYDGDASMSFYRVDFATQSGASATYLHLLRNHTYEVNVTSVAGRGKSSASDAAAGSPANVEATVTVRNESDMLYYVYDNDYYLGVDDREFSISSTTGQLSFDVRTDVAGGWTAVASDSETVPTAGCTWITMTKGTGNVGTSELTFNFTGNSSSTIRIAYIHIMAGSKLMAVIKIKQRLSVGNVAATAMSHGYVGAFWRSDQVGERIIRILRSAQTTPASIEGDWTATVIEGERWIRLSSAASTDPGLFGNSPVDMLVAANDIQYSVGGNLITVSGTCEATTSGEIFFRIGLTGKYTPTADKPVRYGVIQLTYNNNSKSQLIFVRQGEDADYLMRKDDPTGSNSAWTSQTRPLAAKFSPYNLTASAYKAGGGSSNAETSVGVNGGVFANFPTQTGAFFQWANATRTRYAWNPYTSAVTGWNTTSPTTYWTLANGNPSLSANHETCPPNYRRPTDGATYGNIGNSTGASIADSEIRQSLWLNPQPGNTSSDLANSLEGYYADGWFDRRTIVGSAVAAGTVGVAYKGTLLYNPNTYNSLFFPWTGYRNESTGVLANHGSVGWVWTSSKATTGAWNLRVFSDGFRQNMSNGAYAFPIRCVLDE